MAKNLPAKREKSLTDLMPKNWNTNSQSMEAINAVLNMSNQVTETYANIPIICKAARCPYHDTCELVAIGMDVTVYTGQRCPIEIAKVIKKTQGYFQSLDIDESNMVDVGLVKELVDNEMILERINKKLASNPDLTQDVVTSINERTGDVFTKEEVKQIFTLKQNTQNRKDKILQLLNSTRKDKAETEGVNKLDPLNYMADVLAKADAILKAQEKVVVVTPEDVDG